MRSPPPVRARYSFRSFANRDHGPAAVGHRRFHRLLLRSPGGRYRSGSIAKPRAPLARASSSPSFVPWFFSPSLQPRYQPSSLLRPLLTSPQFSPVRSPQVRSRFFPFAPSGYTLCVFDDFWASLLAASSPPARGLSTSSCSYGRRFATRFFQLHLAPTPCGSLRLPSSAPVDSFHSTRICPCWAHSPRRQPGDHSLANTTSFRFLTTAFFHALWRQSDNVPFSKVEMSS